MCVYIDVFICLFICYIPCFCFCSPTSIFNHFSVSVDLVNFLYNGFITLHFIVNHTVLSQKL